MLPSFRRVDRSLATFGSVATLLHDLVSHYKLLINQSEMLMSGPYTAARNYAALRIREQNGALKLYNGSSTE